MAAAGKFKAYDFFKKYVGDGTIDLDDTTNWKAALFLSAGNANTLTVGTGVYGDLTSEHANANGYTTGGVALSGISWTKTGASLAFTFTAPSWTASGGAIVARYMVVYKNATVNTIVKPLAGVFLLDTAPADYTLPDGTTGTFTPNASGVFTLTGATTD